MKLIGKISCLKKGSTGSITTEHGALAPLLLNTLDGISNGIYSNFEPRHVVYDG